jgi:ABC-2 type transport system ATP-binding protein
MLHDVEQICDRVGVLRDGRLIAQGPVRQLRGAEALHIVADPLDQARDVIERSLLVESVSVTGDALVVRAPGEAAAPLNRALIEWGIAVSHLSVHQRSLEDVFLDVTGDDVSRAAKAQGEHQRTDGRGAEQANGEHQRTGGRGAEQANGERQRAEQDLP